MALVTLYPSKLGEFMSAGLGIPHEAAAPSDTPKIEQGMKMPAYVVVEGEGTLVGVFTDKEAARKRWMEDTSYRSIYRAFVDGPVEEVQLEACEWEVRAGYRPEDKIARITDLAQDFRGVCRHFFLSLGRDDLELRFTGTAQAELWTKGPVEHGGTLFLKGRCISRIWATPSDWCYRPGHGATGQC